MMEKKWCQKNSTCHFHDAKLGTTGQVQVNLVLNDLLEHTQTPWKSALLIAVHPVELDRQHLPPQDTPLKMTAVSSNTWCIHHGTYINLMNTAIS